MKWTFKNVIKAIIFYTTGSLLAWTIGVVISGLPWLFKCGWLAFVTPFVVITYLMCKGKTVKEFKEFTGIDVDH